MNIKRNPVYIIISIIIILTMAMTATGCTSTPDEDSDSSTTKQTEQNEQNGQTEQNGVGGNNLSYEQAERNLIDNGTSHYSSLQSLFGEAQNEQGGTLVVSVIPEEYTLSLLRSAGYDIPNKLNPTVFEFNSALDGDNVFANFSYKNGSKEILNADIWIDGNDLILYIPTLLDKFLKEEISYYTDYSIPDIEITNIPSDAEIEKIVSAVRDKYFEIVKDAPVEKDVEFKYGTYTLNCDVTDIELSSQDFIDLVIALLEAVDDSDEVKGYINSVFEQVDDYYAGYGADALISDALESLNDQSDVDETSSVFSMRVYVSGSEIVNREITLISDSGDVEIILVNFEIDNEYVSELTCITYEGSYIGVFASGSKSGDSYSGEASLSIYSYDTGEYVFEISYTDISVDSDGNITGGELTLSSADLIEDGYLSLNLTFGENSFVGYIDVSGIKIATVEMSWSPYDYDGYKPELNSDNTVDINEYFDEVDIAEVLENIGGLDDNGVYDIFGFFFIQMIEDGSSEE